MQASSYQPFDPLSRLRTAAAEREAAGLRRRLSPRQPGHQVLDLASNDYLGLSGDRRLADAAAAAARTWGTGSTGSRLVTGTTALHAELEEELAVFADAPAALVFSSGYLANLATVTALAAALADGPSPSGTGAASGGSNTNNRSGGSTASDNTNSGSNTSAASDTNNRSGGNSGSGTNSGSGGSGTSAASGTSGTSSSSGPGSSSGSGPSGARSGNSGSRNGGVLIVSDERNHASLIDACRLARGRGVRLVVTPHRDLESVDRILAERTEKAALLVTDAVFSVSGELAPVAALHELARRHGALLVLDEAHSFGILGDGGRGAAHAAGIAAEPDLARTITLSKSLSSQGGAVLAAPEVIQTLTDTGRGFIFDTGLAPPSAGAALAALRVLRAEPGRPAMALRNTARLAGLAADLGLAATVPDAVVTSVILGDPGRALAAQRACAASGVRAGCFRPPSVPAGEACLRLTGRATLTEEDFRVAHRALAVVAERCDHCRNTAQAGRSAR